MENCIIFVGGKIQYYENVYYFLLISEFTIMQFSIYISNVYLILLNILTFDIKSNFR